MSRVYVPGSIYRGQDRTQHWIERVLTNGHRQRIAGTRAEIDELVLAWRSERHVQKGTKGWPQ